MSIDDADEQNRDAHLQPQRREWHGSHHTWAYSPGAFTWDGERPVGVNFIPLATEMRHWMQQSGQLSALLRSRTQQPGECTNPYAYSGSAIALMLAQVISNHHDYATTGSSDDDALDAEVHRLRIFNDVLLYSARFCEVVIKQLLYCTQIPESRFRRMALGALLESPCPDCRRRNGARPHTVSMVGTLAHPFHLCIEFDHCAMDHMFLVNQLRNSLAAHSGSGELNVRTVLESKEQLLLDGRQILENVVHLLTHFEKLESQMFEDLRFKRAQIASLIRSGLPLEERNFRLVPGQRFEFRRGDTNGSPATAMQ